MGYLSTKNKKALCTVYKGLIILFFANYCAGVAAVSVVTAIVSTTTVSSTGITSSTAVESVRGE